MRCGIAAVVLATGCLSVPPYQPETSVSYTEASSGTSVAGHDFALHFAGGSGFHFPDALTIDGTDVMGHDPATSCFDEDGAGFQLSPTPRVSADSDAPPVTNQLTPVLRGPAVVQVQLAWSTRLSAQCDPNRSPGGTSTFTVFPDGRIVRHDSVVDPVSSPISAANCTCDPVGGNMGFTVSTYWMLTRSLFPDLYTPSIIEETTAPERQAPPQAMNEIDNHPTACLDHGTYQLAFAWRHPTDTTDTTVIRGGDTLIGFERDMVIRDSMLNAFQWENSSALFIEHHGCTEGLAHAKEHVVPSELRINQDIKTTADRDGIYGGDDGDPENGPPGVQLGMNRAELTGSVNSPFAVWLRFPRSVSALRATRQNAAGAWYLPQQVDDHAWIVWFRDPLFTGETIVVEPL